MKYIDEDVENKAISRILIRSVIIVFLIALTVGLFIGFLIFNK